MEFVSDRHGEKSKLKTRSVRQLEPAVVVSQDLAGVVRKGFASALKISGLSPPVLPQQTMVSRVNLRTSPAVRGRI
jgi:hypothetical protein